MSNEENVKLILKELTRTDLEKLNLWRNSRESVSNLGSAFRYVNIETDEAWFESYISSRATNVRLSLRLERSGHLDEMIGVSYLTDIDWANRNAEFAIWIGEKAHQRKGYGRQATELVLLHAFGDMNLHRVHLTVLSNNEPARKMYSSLGFREEGVLREILFKNGEYVDLILMSIFNDKS